MSALARLGRGWSFPVSPPPGRGSLAYASGPEKVRQAIRIVLATEPGERVMRPTFGCGLRRYLMAPNTIATRALIRADVERALQAWEPRIELRRVSVESADDPAIVEIAIGYVHRLDGRPDNLVFPFRIE